MTKEQAYEEVRHLFGTHVGKIIDSNGDRWLECIGRRRRMRSPAFMQLDYQGNLDTGICVVCYHQDNSFDESDSPAKAYLGEVLPSSHATCELCDKVADKSKFIYYSYSYDKGVFIGWCRECTIEKRRLKKQSYSTLEVKNA